MGTTADKLNKVLQTKEAIRTAINNKGGTLTETDKFSDYPTAIDNIQSGGGNNPLQSILNRTKSAKGLFTGTAYDKSTYSQFYYMNDSELEELMSGINTSSCTNMSYMFNNCQSLTIIPLLNTSSCTNMSYMFYECHNLTTIPQLDTSKVTSMSNMFYGCSRLTTIPLLNTSSCTSMYCTFQSCEKLTIIPQLDTSKVTNMQYTFNGCRELTTVPLLDISSCTYMSYTFSTCQSLTTIPQLDTSKVTSMVGMFSYCSKLITIPLLNTSSCTNMNSMFQSCEKLQSIELTHMKITSTSYSSYFAYDCYSLTKLIIRNIDKIPTLSSDSFDNCYHFYGTTDATYNPQGLKDGRIYVPDDKVEALKTATNWSRFADIIVPLSTLVEE